MKTLSEPHRVTAANAWGRDVTLNHQLLEVELEDVGKIMSDYGGHGHRYHKLTPADVGKRVVMMTSPEMQRDRRSYRMWSFVQ